MKILPASRREKNSLDTCNASIYVGNFVSVSRKIGNIETSSTGFESPSQRNVSYPRFESNSTRRKVDGTPRRQKRVERPCDLWQRVGGRGIKFDIRFDIYSRLYLWRESEGRGAGKLAGACSL